MPRRRLPIGEKKKPLTIMVEGKYLENLNIVDIQNVGYNAIVNFVKDKHWHKHF